MKEQLFASVREKPRLDAVCEGEKRERRLVREVLLTCAEAPSVGRQEIVFLQARLCGCAEEKLRRWRAQAAHAHGSDAEDEKLLKRPLLFGFEPSVSPFFDAWLARRSLPFGRAGEPGASRVQTLAKPSPRQHAWKPPVREYQSSLSRAHLT